MSTMKLKTRVRRGLSALKWFLGILSGYRNLLACLAWLVTTFLNKRYRLDIQPTAIAGIYAGAVMMLRPATVRPMGKKAKRVAFVLSALSAVVGVAFQVNGKWAADVMRYDVQPAAETQALAPEAAPADVPLSDPGAPLD